MVDREPSGDKGPKIKPDGGIPSFIEIMSTAKEEIERRPDIPADIREIVEKLYRDVAEYPGDRAARARLLMYEHEMGVDARQGIELFTTDEKKGTEIYGLYKRHKDLGKPKVDAILDDMIRARFLPDVRHLLDKQFTEAESKAKRGHGKSRK
jgi:hypothetical protein